MADLVYFAIASLDGYVEDESGRFEWAAPSEEVHAFVNDLVREVGTYLYGRRMYETMIYWETAHEAADSEVELDYARVWQAAEKVIYSRSLEEASSAKTRIEREFDPDVVRELKDSAERELAVGGAELAGQALAAGLVDELHLLVVPVIVGAGKPVLPEGVRADLELLDERRFESGDVFLRYRVGT